LIGYDMKSIVLLSGPIAVGKSSVAKELVDVHGFHLLRTSPHLFKLATDRGLKSDRAGLQNLGDSLDGTTDFGWVIDEVAAPALLAAPEVDYWLLDCVRKQRQVEHFRARFGCAVLHLHLTAPEDVLAARYENRRAQENGSVVAPSYASAIAHPNELAARELSSVADIVIDLSTKSPERAALEIAHRFKGGGRA
jgi:chloramphenicol 3-O-phosphotransferase